MTEEEAGTLIVERIKEARERAGFTQANLAEMLGKQLRTWQNYEQGKTSIPAQELYKINQVLGNLDINYYFDPKISYEDALKISEGVKERLDTIITTLTNKPSADPEANTMAQRIAASPSLRKLALQLMEFPDDEINKIDAMIYGYKYSNPTIEKGASRDAKLA